MIVFFEDDLLNLVIVSFHKLFKDLPESSLHKFNLNSTEKCITCAISEVPNETIVMIYSGSVFLNITADVRIIAKSRPENMVDDLIIENWHDYWAGSISSTDDEVTRYIYEYYHKIPGVMVRRIVEALKNASDRSSLRNLLYNNSCNNLQFHGRQLIEKMQHLIRLDNDASLQRSIGGIDTVILLSNFIESAYQLIDRGLDNILLCKINLNQGEVVVTIVSKSPFTLFDASLVHERGVYKTVKIPLKKFIETIS